MAKGTILYIGGFELPDKNAAAHRVLSNGKIFRELGYNVIFIGVDKTLSFNSDISATKQEIQGFECWSIPYPNSKVAWYKYLTNIKFMKLMNKMYIDLKVVIAYNYPSIALIKLIKYCSNNNIRIIGDCTEWYSTKGSNMIFKIIKGLDSFFRMRIVQKKMDGIIVISKYLEEYYKKTIEVLRIPPLVDISEEKWKVGNKQNQMHEINSDSIKLVYSGNPGRNKDKLNYLIETLFKSVVYKDYLLRIIGITKEQYLNDYPEHIKIIDLLGDKIIFLGKISHNRSIEYIKESDFSIFIREVDKLSKAGFPTKFVESISCGVPVITTLTSDLNDYLIENRNGFIINDPKLFITEFKNILETDRDVIDQMKIYCIKNNPFHYSYYIEKMGNALFLN